MQSFLKQSDPEIYDLIQLEQKRLQNTLMMIPSENLASKAVEEAVGSVLGNKYAEGYPGKRYYQGQEVVDKVETLAQERIQKLFGVPFVNVQAYSGSPANFAIEHAILKPGEVLMGLSLASGGHLTHGARLTASSTYFTSVQYDVKPDGYIDYNTLRALALKHKPKLIIAGTTAYARILDFKEFARIADEVDAYLLADISHVGGLVAAGVYPSPVPYAHAIMSTTHKTFRGPRGAMIMVTEKGIEKDPDLPKKINTAIIPGVQGGPHINTIAGIAVAAKEASSSAYKMYAQHVIENAAQLANELKKHGLTLVTGGTDSHLILLDLRPHNILGNTVAEACEVVGIVLNRNAVPGDTNPPFYPQGIRMGTPGITSRGMGPSEMKRIAYAIAKIILGLQNTKEQHGIADELERKSATRAEIIASLDLQQLQDDIKNLCEQFPLPASY